MLSFVIAAIIIAGLFLVVRTIAKHHVQSLRKQRELEREFEAKIVEAIRHARGATRHVESAPDNVVPLRREDRP